MQQRSARREVSAERIFDAAIGVFGERGFHGTSIRDIADASGLSSAALYVHHRSKEELLFEISRLGHGETLRVVAEAADSPGTPSERLRRLMHGYALFHARQHTHARVINYEMAALTPEHRDEIRAIRRDIDRVILGVVTDGVEAGEFGTPDPRMSAIAIESLGIDIARWFSESGDWTPQTVADRYADMALALVAAGPGTPVE